MEVKKVPNLRFPEFKSDWSIKRLGDLCSTFKSGYGITSGNIFDSGEYPVFGGNGLRGYTNTFTHDGFFLLIGRQGALCGNINRVQGKSYISEHAIAVSENDLSSTEWLAQRLDYYNLNRLSESSAQPGLAVNKLIRLKLIVPTKEEQIKIANFLTTVDERINLLTQQKEKLEQYKKGVMQQIFNQQIRFKDDEGNDFPEWEEKMLGEVGEIVSGLTYSPKEIDEKGTLVLRSSNVKNRSIVFDDNVYVLTQNYNPVQENDILICVRNGSQRLIGKNAIIKKSHEGMAFGAFMSVYRSPFNQYIFHFFDTDEYYKNVYRNLGATINSINGSDLKQFKIPFPSPSEQQKIASFLSALDNKIELVKQQIEHTTSWKKGLLQKMFV